MSLLRLRSCIDMWRCWIGTLGMWVSSSCFAFSRPLEVLEADVHILWDMWCYDVRCANWTCESLFRSICPESVLSYGYWTSGSSTSRKHTPYVLVPVQVPIILTYQTTLSRALLRAVCSLCILFQILDELIIAGELQESSKKSVLRVVRPFLTHQP